MTSQMKLSQPFERPTQGLGVGDRAFDEFEVVLRWRQVEHPQLVPLSQVGCDERADPAGATDEQHLHAGAASAVFWTSVGASTKTSATSGEARTGLSW